MNPGTKMKTLFAAMIAVGVLAVSGCGQSKCEQVCTQFNACDLTQRDHDVDCVSFCADEQGFEQRAKAQGAADCHEEFDAYLSCFQNDQDAYCNPDNTACEDSLTAWAECMAPYCEDANNHTDPACLEVDDGVFEPALEFGF